MRILSLFTLLFLISMLPAQSSWEEDEGELQDAQIIIEKDKQLEVPPAERDFSKIPPIPMEEGPQNITYDFQDITPESAPLDLKIRALKLKEEKLKQLYGNQVRAGFGTGVSPYFQAWLNNKRNKQYALGAYFKHLSTLNGPVDKDNSGTSQNILQVNGSLFGDGLTLSGDAGFERNKYYFYGYQPGLEVNKDTIKQVFQQFYGKIGLAGEANALKYGFTAQLGYFRNINQAKELSFRIKAPISYHISEQLQVHVPLYLLFTQYSDQFGVNEQVSSINRNRVGVKPYLLYRQSAFSVKVGLNFDYENDTIPEFGKLHIYPLLEGQYMFEGQAVIRVGLVGGIQENTFQSITSSNPFLGDGAPIFHQNEQYKAYLNASVFISNVELMGGVAFSNIKNMAFFVPQAADSSKYTIVYDPSTSYLNVFGEITLGKSPNLGAHLRADYFGYQVDSVGQAWHKPNYMLQAKFDYLIYEKFRVGAGLYFVGGMRAPSVNSTEGELLDPAIDMNLKLEYLFSKQFLVFISAENIFNQNYQLLLNYPSRGIRIIAGLALNF